MRLQVDDPIGHRLTWRQVFHTEWDRVGFHFSSIGFGVWSIMVTLNYQLPPGTPSWIIPFSLCFDGAFLLVGAFLFAALRNGSYRMRVQGYLIYVIALLLLAIVIFAMSHSPYCLLALGFVFQGLNALRMMRAQQRVIVAVQQARLEDQELGELPPEHEGGGRHSAP